MSSNWIHLSTISTSVVYDLSDVKITQVQNFIIWTLQHSWFICVCQHCLFLLCHDNSFIKLCCCFLQMWDWGWGQRPQSRDREEKQILNSNARPLMVRRFYLNLRSKGTSLNLDQLKFLLKQQIAGYNGEVPKEMNCIFVF